MGKTSRDSADAVRLGILLKVERSEFKHQLVKRVMSVPGSYADKIDRIHEIDAMDDGSLRRRHPELSGEEITVPELVVDEVRTVPAPASPRTARTPAAAPAQAPARSSLRTPVETREADEAFERKSREIAKARRRLYRPLNRVGWMKVMLRERARIQDFGSETGLLRCGLLPNSLVLCPEIIMTKLGVLRDTEIPGLHEVLKPLVADCWRSLGLAQYNRLAALGRFLDQCRQILPEYSASAALSQQLVFFQRVWPDYLALFVIRTEESLGTKFILLKALKAAKTKDALIDLALARFNTIENGLGAILRAVHMVGWRRFFNLTEVIAYRNEELFFADAWDSPPDTRQEIAAWLGSYQAQHDKEAARLREIQRIRYLIPSLPGEGVDRPDLAPLRFWHPAGWTESGISRPLLWLFEASHQYLKGPGRLMAGSFKLADGVPRKLGLPALAGPVVEISDLAKRLLQIKPVLGEIDMARLDALRERPEKGIETERDAIKAADGIIALYGELAQALMSWLALDSLAAPRELQEPGAETQIRRGLAVETGIISEPAEIAGKSVVAVLVEAVRVALLIPLAMGQTALLDRWHGAAAIETQLAGLRQKITRLKGETQA